MDFTALQGALRTIVTTEIGMPQLADLDSSAKLADYDYNTRQLLRHLQLEGEAPGDLEQITFSQLASLLEFQPASVHSKLGELALEARVIRLVFGTQLATQMQPVGQDEIPWWPELVHQILWWYARGQDGAGLELIERDSPGRALQSLASFGLLGLDELAADRAEDRSTFGDELKRLGYPESSASDAYRAIVGIAKKILHKYDGKAQRIVRSHADAMVERIANEFAGDANLASFPKEAIRGWVAVTTGLPISMWSPSVLQFIRKFEPVGMSEEMLAQMAETLEQSLLNVDASLAQFTDDLCLGCTPNKEADQRCVRRFATMNWQVECPGRTQLQSIAQTDFAPGGQRRLSAIAVGVPS
jgi:hypothetical protein